VGFVVFCFWVVFCWLLVVAWLVSLTSVHGWYGGFFGCGSDACWVSLVVVSSILRGITARNSM
jgi:hypothetical protein